MVMDSVFTRQEYKSACPGSYRPLMKLDRFHGKCTECWRGWDLREYKRAPRHGQKWRYV